MKMISISEIFDISYGNSYDLQSLELKKGGIAFIARGSHNNGVVAYVAETEDKPFPSCCLTVSLNGSVLETFYQPQPFYTAYHVKVLKSKKDMNQKELLYYCMVIRANRYRYNYGRQANKTLADILVPHPDFLPDYIQKIRFPTEPTDKSVLHINNVEQTAYNYFECRELFDIVYGANLEFNKMEVSTCGIPFVTRTSKNNGIVDYVSVVKNAKINPGETISVSASGSTMECFYQKMPYYSGRDLFYLKPKYLMSIYVIFYILTILKHEKYRFNYGRQVNKTLPFLKIRLPVTKNGKPNWEFMEDYIKSLPYSKGLAQLDS